MYMYNVVSGLLANKNYKFLLSNTVAVITCVAFVQLYMYMYMYFESLKCIHVI